MPKAPHRPKKEDEFKPDWDLIKRLAEAQCSKAEIAARLDINEKTLIAHIQKKYGISWQEFKDRWKLSGFSALKAKTYEKAVNEGDWNAIKHLRKHWFGEHDKMDVGFDPDKPVEFVLNMGKNLKQNQGKEND